MPLLGSLPAGSHRNMQSDDGQDSRARSGCLHWRPYHSWYCPYRGTRTRSAFTSTRPSLTGLHQLELASPQSSFNWGTTSAFRRSAQQWKTNSRPMGPRSMGPGATYVSPKHSPGNAAHPSALATPPCSSVPAGGAAPESACYSIPAGSAATKEASREGSGS